MKKILSISAAIAATALISGAATMRASAQSQSPITTSSQQNSRQNPTGTGRQAEQLTTGSGARSTVGSTRSRHVRTRRNNR